MEADRETRGKGNCGGNRKTRKARKEGMDRKAGKEGIQEVNEGRSKEGGMSRGWEVSHKGKKTVKEKGKGVREGGRVEGRREV